MSEEPLNGGPMNGARTISPGLKSALELGPVLAFLGAYLVLRGREFTIGGTVYDGFVIATGAFVPLIVLSTWALWRLTGHVSKMQVFTAVLVIVFGGLTVALNDERFIKIKPTIIYLVFAGLLGLGLLRGQSYLQFVLEGALPLTRRGWMILTRRTALFFLAMAAANEIIWRGFSTDVFVAWDTFGQMGATMAFFMGQIWLMKRHEAPGEG